MFTSESNKNALDGEMQVDDTSMQYGKMAGPAVGVGILAGPAVGVGLLAGLGLASLVLAHTVYKKCPPNQLLVIYGRGFSLTGGIQSGTRIVRAGGASVLPIFQSSRYMSLEPMAMEIPLKGALSLEKIRLNVPSVFTIAVSAEPTTSENAARRLLGMSQKEIEEQAQEVIVGQMRQVLAGLTIEEINNDRDKFVTQVQKHCCVELEKLGLELLNTNVQNITDESGVIDALGRKAAAEVKQQAQIDVATQERFGAIGVSLQEKEREIGVRQNKRETRTRMEELEAEELHAVNLARQKKAESEAAFAVANAGFQMEAEVALKEGQAAIAEAEANAKTRVALAHAGQVEAEKRASVEANAKVEKDKTILNASARAEEMNILAEAEAHKVFTIAKAAARGNAQGLREKAEALRTVVDACGGSEDAYRMLLLDHIDKLAETSATAISNIKFDKVVVWDGGDNGSGQGSGAIPGFIKDVTRALPPTLDVLEDIVGLNLKPGSPRDKTKMTSMTPDEAESLATDR